MMYLNSRNSPNRVGIRNTSDYSTFGDEFDGRTVSLEGNRYFNTFEYDAMGNILTQKRHKQDGTQIEDMTYRYQRDANGFLLSNRLYHVNDAVAANIDATDIDDQGSGFNPLNININGAYNYVYDEEGRLVKDLAEGIDQIVWRVDGKVKEINRSTGSTMARLKFDYDAMGRRIAKHVYNNQTGLLEKSTYYLLDAQGNTMATYDYAQAPNQTMSFQLKERHIYGSTRLGMYAEPVVLIEHPSSETNNTVVNQGFKYYEMTNHLGNVLTVIHDIKIPLNNGSGPAVSSYRVGIRNSTDYSPFGVELDGRTVSLDGYRFGYQGSEKDNEFKGEGNSYTTEFRQLDPRLGRWFSIDPVAKKYPFQSPYVSVDNNPLYLADSKGDDGIVKIKGNTITVSSVIYIYGDGATKESAEFIKKQIMNEWNRKDWKYTDENGKVYNVKFNVSVYLYDGKEKADPSFILGAWDPESRNNYIEVLADPKAKHRSFVRGGDEGKWSYGSIKKLLVAAHEFGHILGLPDRYKDGKDGYSVADKGWESNLMGTLSGKVEQRDINRLVAPAVKYRNSIVSAFKGTEIEKKLMEQCEFTYEINP